MPTIQQRIDHAGPAGIHLPREGEMSTLPERFAHFAVRYPKAIAVTSMERSLSYAELEASANRLARRLIAAGAGPDRIVGVSLPRSTDLIVALLAVLKSGAAYLPLDPAYPAARLDYLLSDARPVTIISALGVPIPENDLPRLDLFANEEEGTWDASPIRDSERLSGLHPDQPAYVIYTSGSTGRAKGVVVSHRCVLTLLDATIPMFDLGPADVWTAFHSYAFDFSVWEIWAPLLTGGRTVVVPSEATWSGDEFLALLEAERVTVLNQTPSSFASLERADADGAKALDALRLVIFGGEALDPARLSAWFARRPSRPRMVNMYGITETTVHVTAIDILPEMSLASSESPIGRPLPGFRDHVFDEGLRPVADGQVGELYLGGAQVSRGYFDRPALTATRFVADPDSHGGRLYRTGDLVRPLRGNLNFIGRADTQLSLRGFRIEPNEVEAALDAYQGVTASAVTVKPDPDGNEGEDCLAAYVVVAGGTLDERGLRVHLARLLPAHLVPSHIMLLAALPLTPNRKLDRAALPPPPPRKTGRANLREELLRRRLGNRP
ncbi:amino acid adenylation domain-containing protein [Rhizobium tumorigenes]|uniref:Amino acid adenylation domain-containing protein n=1 Tax=Rhizobium tumorigenes TaxID=2041385 RepID=A0AAF1KW09_9HYPH|nr:amino acid adenylation domain-containing protein [Rhizobium tumorigenes]WFR97526.1 amino acid adenylation domain-containing protein [Rhizobium tumorigenes]